MNCNKGVYDELSKHIELDDEIDIWQTIDEEKFQLIPNSYRKVEGVGENIVIGFQ